MATNRIFSPDLSTPQIIAESSIMQRVLVYAANIAQSDSSAVIYGESGTGKSALAKYIFLHSARRDGPFIAVNCASLPTDRIDTELWGHGLQGTSLFESANNGTLFLENISALPFSAQTRIYNTIRRRSFRRPNTNELVPCDVRVLVSSQKNLKELVEDGTFFDSLYYTLSVFIITVPPLRQRKEDIIPLALNFLDSFNSKYHTAKVFQPETLHYFKESLWPGNIRELHNTVERMYTMSSGDVLFLEQPAPHADLATSSTHKETFSIEPENLCLKLAVEEFEKQFIQYVIAKCHNNVAEAARQMGIHRTGLYKKLEKYGIHIIR